jgi:hypothetical protein
LFEVDFSNEIGRNPSLSQLDEWLSDAFQPPKRHVPEREQSTVSLAPSATPSVEPAKQTRVREESPITEERRINVEYILFIASPKEKSSSSRLAKRKAPPEVEYTKFVSDAGKISFSWDLSNINLRAFKEASITSIRLQDTPLLADHARNQEDGDLITWAAMIPHGGMFSAKNKATLDSPKDFFSFIEACQALDDKERKCQITMIEKDPKLIAQVRSHCSQTLF